MKGIKFDKRNYRKHGDRNKKLIEKSLKECGAGRSIVVDADGEIIAGNGIYEAAQKAKIPVREIETDGSELVVVRRTDLHTEDAKRKQLAVMDNSTSDSSEFDLALLQEDFDIPQLKDLGIDLKELDEPPEILQDELPEEVEPTAKSGDVFVLGNHRLICGDSTDAEVVARLMDGKRADMVFTDPPYNVAIGDKNKALNTFRKGGITKNIEGDAGMTDEEISEKLWFPVFRNLYDFAKDECSIYVTMPQGGTHMMMMMMMQKAFWNVKHELVWVKNQPTFSMGRLDYDYQHEPIVYGWKKTHKWIGKGKFNKSIWNIDKPKKSELHPTMKPVELVVNAILNSSEEGDIILDLFGGSGTTLVACEQTGRSAFLSEIDPHYCDIIVQRWERLTGKKAELEQWQTSRT